MTAAVKPRCHLCRREPCGCPSVQEDLLAYAEELERLRASLGVFRLSFLDKHGNAEAGLQSVIRELAGAANGLTAASRHIKSAESELQRAMAERWKA